VRASGGASLSQAVSSALAGIAAEARHDEALAERVALWKDRLRERGGWRPDGVERRGRDEAGSVDASLF
jgi:hypothetical protein